MKPIEKRRRNAFERLEAQLTSQTKTQKKSTKKIALTAVDVERIKVELTNLKKNI